MKLIYLHMWKNIEFMSRQMDNCLRHKSSSVTIPLKEQQQSPYNNSSHDNANTEDQPERPNTGSNQITTKTSAGSTVLVTGAAGFLGQHIVKLLQTKAEHVKEIRILDLKEYNNLLGHSEYKPVQSIVGCVTDPAVVRRACRGVDSVYHVAGRISYGTFPDIHGMYKVNVQGTANIIQACLDANVRRLIFCSTVDVVIGYDYIIDGCEVTTATPEHFLFPGYPETKHKAESLVLKANGNPCKNGEKLRTLSLRANVMYGEGDPYYVTNGLKNAQSMGNILYQIGDGSAVFQPAYVGNTAWAFICADKALNNDVFTGGQFYFTPDDTPIQNTFKFMEPFLEVRGYRLSSIKLPFRLVYNGLLFLEMIVNVLSPLFKITLPAESYSVKYINMDLYFNNRKARDRLGYKPLYSPEVAMNNSLKYYKNLQL